MALARQCRLVPAPAAALAGGARRWCSSGAGGGGVVEQLLGYVWADLKGQGPAAVDVLRSGLAMQPDPAAGADAARLHLALGEAFAAEHDWAQAAAASQAAAAAAAAAGPPAAALAGLAQLQATRALLAAGRDDEAAACAHGGGAAPEPLRLATQLLVAHATAAQPDAAAEALARLQRALAAQQPGAQGGAAGGLLTAVAHKAAGDAALAQDLLDAASASYSDAQQALGGGGGGGGGGAPSIASDAAAGLSARLQHEVAADVALGAAQVHMARCEWDAAEEALSGALRGAEAAHGEAGAGLAPVLLLLARTYARSARVMYAEGMLRECAKLLGGDPARLADAQQQPAGRAPAHASLRAALAWRFAQLLTALPSRGAEAAAWSDAARALWPRAGAGLSARPLEGVLGDAAALTGQGAHGAGGVVAGLPRRLLPPLLPSAARGGRPTASMQLARSPAGAAPQARALARARPLAGLRAAAAAPARGMARSQRVRSASEAAAVQEAAPSSSGGHSASAPTSDVLELDFCSRPLLDERGKKVWELLICSPDRSFEYSQYFPNSKINSVELRKALEAVLARPGAVPPTKVRFFRGQMSTIISRALSELNIKPLPSRRCFSIMGLLEARLESVYRTDPRYSDKASSMFDIDLGPPEPLPDALRGEKWAFVQLPLGSLRGMLKPVEEGTMFGSSFDLAAAGLGELPADILVPGVVVFSRRALPLAAWTNGLEISGVKADVERSCLILETGVNQRWRYGGWRPSPDSIGEAEGWEEAKAGLGGLHFLAVQPDPDAEDVAGLPARSSPPRRASSAVTMRAVLVLALLGLLAVGGATAQNKTDVTGTLEKQGFKLAAALLDAANVTKALDNPAAYYTLLVPTDKAITDFLAKMGLTPAAVLGDPVLARKLVAQHLILGHNVRAQDIFDKGDARVVATKAGKPNDLLFRRGADGKVTVTDVQGGTATVGKYIVIDDNKTAHPVNKVLLSDSIFYSLADLCAFRPLTISALCRAIAYAGLEAPLSAGNLTLFGPNNAAFNKAVKLTGGDTPSPARTAELLKYHVVPGIHTLGSYAPLSLRGGKPVTTLQGQTLVAEYATVKPAAGSKLKRPYAEVTIDSTGGTKAKVLKPNVYVGKSIVHGINAVLIPAAGPTPAANATAPGTASRPAAVATPGAKPAGRRMLALLDEELTAARRALLGWGWRFNGGVTAEEDDAESDIDAAVDGDQSVSDAAYESQYGAEALSVPGAYDDIEDGVSPWMSPARLLLLALALCAVASAQAQNKTDVKAALEKQGFKLAAVLLDAAGMTAKLNAPKAHYTLLVPNDKAITDFLGSMGLTAADLAARPLLAKQLVAQHLILGHNVRAEEIFDRGDARVVATLAGPPNNLLFRRLPDKSVKVTDVQGNVANVKKYFAIDDNKSAHPVDKVLLSDNVFTSFAALCRLRLLTISTFCHAYLYAGLNDTLAGGRAPLTVFVPNNAAIVKAELKLTGGAAPSPAEAAAIIKYHVVPGVRQLGAGLPGTLKNGASVPTTLPGHNLTIKYNVVKPPAGSSLKAPYSDVEVFADSGTTAKVLKANVHVGQAIVHGIDAVLIPAKGTPAPTTKPAPAAAGRRMLSLLGEELSSARRALLEWGWNFNGATDAEQADAEGDIQAAASGAQSTAAADSEVLAGGDTLSVPGAYSNLENGVTPWLVSRPMRRRRPRTMRAVVGLVAASQGALRATQGALQGQLAAPCARLRAAAAPRRAAHGSSGSPGGGGAGGGRETGHFTDPGNTGFTAEPGEPDTATPDRHPDGPADTSSLNAAAGHGAEPRGARARDIHHPGRPDAAPGAAGGGGGSADAGDPSPTAAAEAAARARDPGAAPALDAAGGGDDLSGGSAAAGTRADNEGAGAAAARTIPPGARQEQQLRQEGSRGSSGDGSASGGDASGGDWLAKALAAAGVASRRRCIELVREGSVAVNGVVVTDPARRVRPGADTLEVGGRRVGAGAAPPARHYFALHKPPGYICSSAGERRAVDLLAPWLEAWRRRHPGALPPRLFTVGRLDVATAGLIFVTNDGDWANRVIHPSSNVLKEYRVALPAPPTERELDALAAGTVVKGVHVAPKALRVLPPPRGAPRGGRTTLALEVSEGKTREVRLLVAAAGLRLLMLTRVRIGGWVLPRDLPPGGFVGVLAQALAEENFTGGTIYVQVLDMTHITPKDGAGPRRTKITCSDGVYKCVALLATQLREQVDSGAIQRGSVIAVRELVGNKKLGGSAANASKKLLIFLNLDVVAQWPDIIGDPQPVPDAPAPGPAQQHLGGAPPPQYGAYGGPPPAGGAPAPGGGYGAPPHGGGGGFGGPPPAAAGGMFGAPAPAAAAAPGSAPGMYRPGGGGGGYGGGYGGGGGPVTQSADPPRIVPVSALNPYLARWTIRARVTQKGDVRRWSNPRSEGKLMSFDLVDADGSEIRATAWNDQVDQYADLVQLGRVVTISKASLKPRNPKFNTTPHEYEIYLERSSVVAPADEDPEAAAIPFIMFNFKKLSELQATEAGGVVDVVGVLESAAPWGLITRKDGSETRKRNLVIRDDSGCSVEVTLWDKFVHAPGDALEAAAASGGHPVVAIKGARVGDFNGKSLSTLSSSTVLLDPERPETAALRNWWDNAGGATMAVSALSGMGGGGGRSDRRVTFRQIETEGLGLSPTADWVAVAGTVYNISSDRGLAYPACTRDFNGRPCQKKLQGQEGSWFCERCQQSCEAPAWRYLLTLQAQDHTGSETVTAFGDSGEAIMGCPAEAVANPEALDSAAYGALVQSRLFASYLFKLKVFQDTYNDEARRKISISKLAPLDFAAEGRQLLDYIARLEAGEAIMGPTAAPGGAGAARGGLTPPGGRGAAVGGGGPPAYGGAPPAYGGGGGGYGAPPPAYGGGGGYGAPPPGGGGYGGPPGGYGGPPQQPPQYGGAPAAGGGWGGGGGGGGYGAPPAAAGGYQQPGGYGAPPPQQQQQQQPPFNQQQPFAAGWA
ncbi:RPA1A [Scenedesmus sp. PABB004]|nr:RPA1A [Scenedesmus sp. PABB004]